jgi:hypothetical protein
MSDNPSTAIGNGNGRSDGTFAPGHKFAKGNPNNRKAQRLRNAGLRAVSVKDMLAIFRKAVEDAKNGDAQARAWVADRLMGKVSEQAILERIESLEALMSQRNGTGGKWS